MTSKISRITIDLRIKAWINWHFVALQYGGPLTESELSRVIKTQRQREDAGPLDVRGDEKNPPHVVRGGAAPCSPHPADEGSTASIPSGARMAPLGHFAEFLDLTLNALGILPARSPSPLIKGTEDAHHPMKRDGDKELVFSKAS